jgi:hypothetical protein
MNHAGVAMNRRSSILRLERIDLEIGWLPLAAFICGIASARAVNLIGEFYVGELLVIQLALLVMLLGRDRSLLGVPAFGIFVQTAVLMLAGYIISDLYRETEPGQFLRGWARVILLTLDFIALAIIVSRDKRTLWWFVLGMGVGAIVQLLVRGVPMMSPAGWKFGYSTPLMYLLACASYFLPIKLMCLAFAGLGVWNIFMDFRVVGAICLLIAAILWVRANNPDGLAGFQLVKLFSACLVAAAVIGTALYVTHEEYARRRDESNVGREAGLVVAMRGIIESPVIGYGSWPTDHRLVSLYQEEITAEGKVYGDTAANQVFTAHSQALQAWIEGGLLAALFFIYYGLKLVSSSFFVALKRRPDGYLPIFLVFLIYNTWHLFMSPFSGPTRVPIAVGIAIICMVGLERYRERAAERDARRAASQVPAGIPPRTT